MSSSIYMTGIVVCAVLVVVTERQFVAAKSLSRRTPQEHNLHRHHHRRHCSEAINDQGSLANEVPSENKESYGELRATLERAVCGHTRTSKWDPDDWLRLEQELNYEKCKSIFCCSEEHRDCCCVHAARELPPPQDASKQKMMRLTGCVCTGNVDVIHLSEPNPQLNN